MTEAPTSSGGGSADVENPIQTTTIIGSGTVGSGIADNGRKKQCGLVSVFLLVAAIVAISVGVTVGGGSGENATTVENSSSAIENAGKREQEAVAVGCDSPIRLDQSSWN